MAHAVPLEAVQIEMQSNPSRMPVRALAGGEELVYRAPGVQQTVLRRLRRGEYRIEREIDLHGLTVAEANLDFTAINMERF